MTTSTGSTTTPRPRPARDRKKPGSAINAFPANIPPTTKVVRNTTYGTPSRLSVQQEGTNVSHQFFANSAALSDPNLTATAKVTYYTLAAHGTRLTVTISQIMGSSGLSRGAVKRSLESLTLKGYLIQSDDHDNGENARCLTYQVIPAPVEAFQNLTPETRINIPHRGVLHVPRLGTVAGQVFEILLHGGASAMSVQEVQDRLNLSWENVTAALAELSGNDIAEVCN